MDFTPVTDPGLLKELGSPEGILPDTRFEPVTDPELLRELGSPEAEGFEPVTDPELLKELGSPPLPIPSPQRPARLSPSVQTHVAEQERKLKKLGLPVTGSEAPAFLDAHARKPKPVDMGDLGNEFLRSVGQQNFDLYAEALMIQHDLTGDPQAKEFADLLKRTAKSMEGGVAPRTAKQNLTDVRSIQEAIDWAQASMGQGFGSTMGPLVGGGMGYFGGKKVAGKVGGKLGAGVGALFGSAPLSLGEMRKALLEEGVEDPKLRAEWAIKGGLAMAALDSALPASLASKIMSGGTRKAIQRGIVKRIMQGGARSAAVEGATEGTQASIEYLVKKHASGNPVSPEEWAHAAFNEGAAGVVGGAGMGATTGAIPDQPVVPVDETADPSVSVAPPPPQPTSELKADRLTLEQQVSILQQQGYEDEQIVEMDDAEREAAAVEGQQAGIEPIAGLPSGDSETAPVEAEAPTPVTPPPPEETPQAPLPESAPIEPEERGTRNKPQKVEAAQDLDEVRRRVDTEPTEKQKAANNYSHAHLKLHSFDISIENPKGSVRRGKNADGTEYAATMPADYGYIKRVGARSRDGDHVDVFVGSHPESKRIFVIDQTKPDGTRLDEPKLVFGTTEEVEAVHLYHSSFSDGKGVNRIAAITETTPELLRKWLEKGSTKYRFARQKRFHGIVEQAQESRLVEDTGVPVVATHAGPLSEQGEQELPSIRRRGDNDLPAVGQLSDVPRGYGAEAEPQAQSGQDQRQTGVQPGELPVGDTASAIPESTEVRASDNLQRQDDDTGGVGKGAGHLAEQSLPPVLPEETPGRDVEQREEPPRLPAKVDNVSGRDVAREDVGQKDRDERQHSETAPQSGVVARESADNVARGLQEDQKPEWVKQPDGTHQLALKNAEAKLTYQSGSKSWRADVRVKDQTSWAITRSFTRSKNWAEKWLDSKWGFEGGVADAPEPKDQTIDRLRKPDVLTRQEPPKTGNLYQFVITDKQRAHLKSRVNVIAKRIMGRTLPTIEFHDTLPGGFEGAFLADEWLIYLALQAKTDPRLVLRHEAVHVLKNVGLFTDGEWRVLSRLAERKWIDQFQIRNRYEHYDKGRPNFDELMIEEAIADAFLYYSANGPQKNAADRIFEKLKRLIEAIRNMLKGEGFTSVNDIFDKIESGEVASRKVTQTKAFKKWFGNSQIVDPQGNPLVVYHGTPVGEIDTFKTTHEGKYMGLRGAYFATDPKYASVYAMGKEGPAPTVYPVFLKVEKPLVIKDLSFWEKTRGKLGGFKKQFAVERRLYYSAAFSEAEVQKLKEQGYDGVVNEGRDEIVVFDPTQIKSATGNRGTFNAADPNILTAAQPPDGNWPTGSVTDPKVGPDPKDFQSNINLDKIAAPEDVKAVITTVGERAQEFITERRGVVSNEQTKELAKELGMNAAELAKRTTGQAFNAHEIYAARVLMVQSASTVRTLAAKASQTKTLHDLAQFQKAFTRHVAIQEQIAGMTAEAGRALQQFKMMAGANYLPIAKAMADEAKAKDKKAPFGAKTKTGTDAIVHLADMINALDDPSQLNRFTRDAFKVTIWDKIREIWINALLSGPRTHATNILSNFITALWQVPETSVAAMIGSLHGGDKVRAREATARLIGVIEGTKEGLGKATTAFITGEPTDAMSKVEQHRRKAVGGMVGEIVRIPSKALLAEDEFFKTLNRMAEINARAARLALNEGLKGQALSQRIAELKANPPPSLKRAADEWALYQTFQNHMGPIGTMVMRLRDSVPGLYLLMPFIRTPANLIKYAAERTPFGLIMGSVRENLSGKNGNIARDMQLARMGLGSSIALVIGSWAMAGILTGSGPDDPDERRLWLEDHQPYAIRFGDTWVSYQRMDPFGLILGITADLIGLGEAVMKADGEKVGSMIVGALSQNLLNKTWLSGLSDFIEAVQDPQRYGEGYVRRMAGTLIPNLSAQIAQTIDPVLRDAQTTLDNIKTRIPGMGKELPPRRNIFGEPIRREGSLGPDLLSPLYLKTDTEDPVVNAMLEIDYAPSMPSRRINGHELTPEEYSEYAEIAGKEARVRIEPQVRGKGWRSMPPDLKIKRIKRAFDESRELARKRMKRRYPHLRKGAI